MVQRNRFRPSDATALDVLEHAAGLVSRGWVRAGYARDAHRRPVSPSAPVAVAWCLQGSVWRARLDLRACRAASDRAEEALRWAADLRYGEADYMTVNDRVLASRREAVALIDLAAVVVDRLGLQVPDYPPALALA